MTPERYRRVTDLFVSLQDRSPQERQNALDAEPDDQVRQQVRQMLEAETAASRGFLNRPAVELLAGLLPPETVHLPEPGATLGQYRLVRLIRTGGMAAVFEAEDLRLSRRVAVKILPRGGAGAAEDRVERFRREARAVSSLSHPNIVSIFDADTAQGFPYIAMEYVEGRTLRQVIASGELPDRATLLDWVGQTARALKAAHEAGVIHRDIKPENVMIRPDGFIKVLDFGLAKLLAPASDPAQGMTRPGHVAGTIHYLAPEQISGGAVTPRSDLFSLGVLAYELATGVKPFDGATDGLIYSAILAKSPAPPSSIRPALGPEVDRWILRAIEKDPARRPDSAFEFQSDASRLLPVVIAPPPSRRWLPAAALLLAAALGLLWIWRQAEPASAPQVVSVSAVTHAGQVKSWATDGARIYYTTPQGMFQVSVKGGDPVPLPYRRMKILDLSPDGSELLLAQYPDQGLSVGDLQLWTAPVAGTAPRPLGGLRGDDASFSPDGSRVAVSRRNQLAIATRDGAGPRLLRVPPGIVGYPAWSPDGREIRAAVVDGGRLRVWALDPQGAPPRPVLPDLNEYNQDQVGWSRDGRWFFFPLQMTGLRRDLWVRDENNGRRTRLTSGPMSVNFPRLSPDSKRIFVTGEIERGELVRRDERTGQWLPFLGGLPATQLEYSRDGRWITYIGPPGHSVWRAAADGTQRIQLTGEDLLATNPRFSPNGARITFFGNPPNQRSRIYIVPAAGGEVRAVTNGESGPGGETDASWSADGKQLVYGVQLSDQLSGRPRPGLRVLHLAAGSSRLLAGSEGLWSPRWSPDGRFVVALGEPNLLWLYDLTRGVRTRLTDTGAGFPSWSPDSRFVYFEDGGTNSWRRVEVASRRVETVASLRGLTMASFTLGWAGLAADGGLLSTREAGSSEVYMLEWK